MVPCRGEEVVKPLVGRDGQGRIGVCRVGLVVAGGGVDEGKRAAHALIGVLDWRGFVSRAKG